MRESAGVVGVTDFPGISLVITSLGTFVGIVFTAIQAYRNGKVVQQVHQEVRTLNETPIGQLAAATETRRVEALAHDDRTAREQRHVDEAPPNDPPQGPGR